MKLNIERSSLLKSLQHVQGVVERRTTIPILSNVLLKASGSSLAMTATDMDLAIVEKTGGEIAQEGSTTVSAHTLLDIVRKLPEGAQIEIASGGDENRLEVKCGRSRLNLATLPSEDFPAMSEGDLPNEFILEAGTLKGIIDRTRFAMSNEETRYYLNGLYIHRAQSDGVAVLRTVATDGHRLARVEMPLPDGADEMPGVSSRAMSVSRFRRQRSASNLTKSC